MTTCDYCGDTPGPNGLTPVLFLDDQPGAVCEHCALGLDIDAAAIFI
jgi:hypothetical protein